MIVQPVIRPTSQNGSDRLLNSRYVDSLLIFARHTKRNATAQKIRRLESFSLIEDLPHVSLSCKSQDGFRKLGVSTSRKVRPKHFAERVMVLHHLARSLSSCFWSPLQTPKRLRPFVHCVFSVTRVKRELGAHLSSMEVFSQEHECF